MCPSLSLSIPPSLPPSPPRFDSNVITPGTEFMYRLGLAFRKWIDFKMETDPFWKVREGGREGEREGGQTPAKVGR